MVQKMLGETVYDTNGHPYILSAIVGSGGQGVVFEEQSRTWVVKIARFKNSAKRDELRRRYVWLLNRELASDSKLVVPSAVLDEPYVGYVMPRVKGHCPLRDLLSPPSDVYIGTWYGLKRRLLLGAQIAMAFDSLHSEGLAYCDLSDSNILVAKDPRIVSICLVDPDNLSVSGRAESLVMGTLQYMAPEVVKNSHQPDSLTDNYSLAIILFQLLRLGHPFIGDYVNDGPPDLEEKAYSGDLPYVEHPYDQSNHSTGLLPSCTVFTCELASLFNQVFVEGRDARRRRPQPEKWWEALTSAAENSMPCIQCKSDILIPQDANICSCTWCGSLNKVPPRAIIYDSVKTVSCERQRLERGSIVLTPGMTSLFQRHVGSGVEIGPSEPVISLEYIAEKGIIVLHNNSGSTVFVRTGTVSEKRRVQPGKPVDLIDGSKIIVDPPMDSAQVLRIIKLQFGGTAF